MGGSGVTHKSFSDNELDAMIVRSLSRLPRHGPSRDFASRVMNRVQLPQPRAVRAYRRARTWLSQPRHAMAFAAAYATVAVLALIVAVPWLFEHSPAIRLAVDWAAGRAGALMREATITAAGWAVSSGLTRVIRSVSLTGPQIWALAFGATVAYAGGAVVLRHLLRAPRDKHAAATIQA
jgi:hypothetical protein